MMKKILCVFLIVHVAYATCWFLKPRTRKSNVDLLRFSHIDPGEPLILTHLIGENNLDLARNLSRVTHPDFLGVDSYSGFITVNKSHNSSLFFWFFPAEENYRKAPVVLWLQGGPGSSSLFGLFEENGPFLMKTQDTLSLRNYSWSKTHSMLYIDNPVGTGFSFTNSDGFATEQTQVGEELFEFLQQFFTLFPELQKNDFHVTGESYAGKYVPAIGYTILMKNPRAKLKINLQGLAIGDGLTDPIHQHEYSDYVYQIGLVDNIIKNKMKDAEKKTLQMIETKQWREASESVGEILNLVATESGVSLYNYLDSTTNLPEHSQYLERNDIRKALHVGSLPYGASTDLVRMHLINDMMQSVAPWMIELLNNYRVLVYTGQVDIMVAYPLTLNYLQHLNFSSAEEYKSAPRKFWYADNELAGYVKQAGNLTEVLVRNAGHLVPGDQPKWAYDLIYKFVRNIPLSI